MGKRSAACGVLAACMVLSVCGCGAGKEEDVFTGETPDRPEWQANLDAVSPSVYTNIDDLKLEPGTYISVIVKAGDTA